MSKSRLKKSHKGLALIFILFFATILSGFFGFDNVSKVLFYAIFPVFFWTYYHTAIYVIKFNKKAYKRVKNKQSVFTNSLSDDEDDDEYESPYTVDTVSDNNDSANSN